MMVTDTKNFSLNGSKEQHLINKSIAESNEANTPKLLITEEKNKNEQDPFEAFCNHYELDVNFGVEKVTTSKQATLGSELIKKETDESNNRFSLSLDEIQARGRYSQSIRSKSRKRRDDDTNSILSYYSELPSPPLASPSNPEQELLDVVDRDLEDKLNEDIKRLQSMPKQSVPEPVFFDDKVSLMDDKVLYDEPDNISVVKKRMDRVKSTRRASRRYSTKVGANSNRPISVVLPTYAVPNVIPPTPTTEQPNDSSELNGIDEEHDDKLKPLRPNIKRNQTVFEPPLNRNRTVSKKHTRSRSLINEDLRQNSMNSWEEAKSSWKHQYSIARKFRRSPSKDNHDDDKVLIGTRVAEGHQNYALMYNMLTGIRVSVSRCSAKPMLPLTMTDFDACNKLAFDVTGNELVPSSKYDFKFKDYAPNAFRQIRAIFHIDPAEYLMSLTSKYIVSELFSPGKSRSFFYFSRDYRFIIKTIHHVEHRFMRKILPQYFQYVKNNPDTLLTRIYGLHRVKIPYARKIHFVVMANILPPNRDIHETYDLKGSTLGRKVEEATILANPSVPMKDLNWLETNRKFQLSPAKRALLMDQLTKDAKLLCKLKIMDYSLLVGIHYVNRGNQDNLRERQLSVFQPDLDEVIGQGGGSRTIASVVRRTLNGSDLVALEADKTLPDSAINSNEGSPFYKDDGGFASDIHDSDRDQKAIYYLGVIDILTPYNYAKKVEHHFKALNNDRTKISAVNPKVYCNRFLDFMSDGMKDTHSSPPEGSNLDEDGWTTSNDTSFNKLPDPQAKARRRHTITRNRRQSSKV